MQILPAYNIISQERPVTKPVVQNVRVHAYPQ